MYLAPRTEPLHSTNRLYIPFFLVHACIHFYSSSHNFLPSQKQHLIKPPPPRGPPPAQPSTRPAPTRRIPDREDEDGNLAGFVVPDDIANEDDGEESIEDMHSEDNYDEDEVSEDDVREQRVTKMRQMSRGDSEGREDYVLELGRTDTKARKSLTDEDHTKRNELAVKRKKQAEKMAEKTKQDTIERILNQKGSKGKREEKEPKKKVETSEKQSGLVTPHYRIISNHSCHQSLGFSSDVQLPPFFDVLVK